MTVREFCLHETQAQELVAITENGYILEVVWIDYEDLFRMSSASMDMEVHNDYWGHLPIVTQHGDEVKIPCHFLRCE